jgi:hypothetical protein
MEQLGLLRSQRKEEQLLGNAAYMAKHFRQFSWEYVVCDIQWSDSLAESGTDTGVTADWITDPFSISKWNSDMYGLLDLFEAQAYYDSLSELYAALGVDYVKVDDTCNTNMYPHDPYGT